MEKNVTLKNVTGSCLCGTVKFSFGISEKVFDACHCGMCRKWAGGPGLGVNPSTPIKYSGEESIKVYESSAWAERAFCKNCGTHLFYRLKDKSFMNIPLGTIDNNGDFKFHVQIFVDSNPGNYSFANHTKQMTEAQVLAAFKSKE